MSPMANHEIELPRNALAAATLVIFLHWSGATFIDSGSATTWLGAVKISRGWMIGIFIHLWFVVSYVLLWQKRGAQSFREIRYRHRQFLLDQLLRQTPAFLELLRTACRDAEHDDHSRKPIAPDDLIAAIEKNQMQVISDNDVITYIPVVEHKWFDFRYYVDFSRVGHVLGTKRGGPVSGTSMVENMPCYAIPRKYLLKFLAFELKALWTVISRQLAWHQEFLPWILAWVALLSAALGSVGLL